MRVGTNNRLRIMVVIAAVVVVAAASIGSSKAVGVGDGIYEQFGVTIRQILSRSDDGPTLATVNGLAITQRQMDIALTARRFGGQSTSQDVAMDQLISRAAALSEAQKRGIVVSDAELAAFIANQRRIADQDPDKSFYRYAAALGVSDAAIWSYPPVVNEWRTMLTVSKLRVAVVGEITQSNAGAKNAQWAAFLATLKKDAVVTR